MNPSVTTRVDEDILIVTIDRPHTRNAVDRATAERLHECFSGFDRDDSLSVAILTGAGGTFCAGADLKAIAADNPDDANAITVLPASDILGSPGPVGPSRLNLSKPVIAAIEGHAVAGGLELAVWADLRVAAHNAILGVFCRRWGVPLIDGGTLRLPRLIGAGRAMDLILTGRAVDASEALQMGLVNRVTDAGQALDGAIALAREIAAHPQACLRVDRRSAIDQWGQPEAVALAQEVAGGMSVLAEAVAGARRFSTDRT